MAVLQMSIRLTGFGVVWCGVGFGEVCAYGHGYISPRVSVAMSKDAIVIRLAAKCLLNSTFLFCYLLCASEII